MKVDALVTVVLFLKWVRTASGTHVVSNGTSETRLLRLYPSSLEKCMDACLYSNACQRAVFQRLANLCDLHSTLEKSNDYMRRWGISITLSDITKRRSLLRNVKKAVHNHTNACSLSRIAKYYQLGNMNRAGDRIIVDYGKKASKCMTATFSCKDDGAWNQTDCTNHTSILTESETPRDCDDIVFGENLRSGIYWIYPKGSEAVEVFCDFENTDGPWTVIQRRVDDTVNFTRTYKEYQEGFGSPYGNFWLGLESISRITTMNCKSYMLKVILKDTVNGVRYANYSLFQVLNVSVNYKLLLGGYSGNAGDSLAYHNGSAFSTYDRDNDNDLYYNCGTKYSSGGWWFNNCFHSNLNGQYGNNEVPGEVRWFETTRSIRSATFATMKLREK